MNSSEIFFFLNNALSEEKNLFANVIDNFCLSFKAIHKLNSMKSFGQI